MSRRYILNGGVIVDINIYLHLLDKFVSYVKYLPGLIEISNNLMTLSKDVSRGRKICTEHVKRELNEAHVYGRQALSGLGFENLLGEFESIIQALVKKPLKKLNRDSRMRRQIAKNIKKLAGILDQVEGEYKRLSIEDILKSYDVKSAIKRSCKLLSSMKREIQKYALKIETVRGELIYRGVVGTRYPFGFIPFEIGLCWDFILQIPFIPGSSVKGAVRCYAEVERYSNIKEIVFQVTGTKLKNEEAEKYVNELFGLSEGEEARIGSVYFYDAYPVELGEANLLLEPDVITPIYGEDDIEEHHARPKPIPHLVIARGTKFEFILASQNKEHLAVAKKLLIETMRYGMGARTSVGYTLFKPC